MHNAGDHGGASARPLSRRTPFASAMATIAAPAAGRERAVAHYRGFGELDAEYDQMRMAAMMALPSPAAVKRARHSGMRLRHVSGARAACPACQCTGGESDAAPYLAPPRLRGSAMMGATVAVTGCPGESGAGAAASLAGPAAELRPIWPAGAGTIPLRQLGAVGLDDQGAARLAAAYEDLMPRLPRRFSNHEGGHEAATMLPAQAPKLAPFSGGLPDDIVPGDHGVPWDWPRVRLLGDPIAWRVVQSAERDYEKLTGRKPWIAPTRGESHGQNIPHPHADAWDKAYNARKAFGETIEKRLEAGKLRLFVYNLKDDGCWQWLAPIQAAEFLRLLHRQPSYRGGAVSFAGMQLTRPHLHIADGLPLSLAALAFAPTKELGQLERLKREVNGRTIMRRPGTTPPEIQIDRLMDGLRGDLVAQLATGKLIAVGESGTGYESIPPAAWMSGVPDFVASALGAFSDVLVRLPLPATAAPTRQESAPLQRNPERRAEIWMLKEYETGRRERNKSAWESVLKANFPGLSGEAFSRIWKSVSVPYPEISKSGRKPARNQTG